MIGTKQLSGLLLFVGVLLAACGTEEGADSNNDRPPVDQSPPATANGETRPEETSEPTHEEKVEAILEEVPVVRLDLGEFPYFALPDGYRVEELTYQLESAPFWVANGTHWVEGTVYQAAIFAESEQAFSERSLREDIEFMITTVGGVKVSEVDRIRMHVAESNGITGEVRNKFRFGLGHFYANPVSTYLLRVHDGDVWIHFTSFSDGANLLMTKARPHIPSGHLLSGADLKTLIDLEGRAIVEINFEVGRASIMQRAIPQIDQIGELLSLDPELRLSVNGHTDDTGGAERNLLLSQQRAESVVAALVERGVDPSRLEARGHGQDQPIADNTTETGRARNRRVELVPLEEDYEDMNPGASDPEADTTPRNDL